MNNKKRRKSIPKFSACDKEAKKSDLEIYITDFGLRNEIIYNKIIYGQKLKLSILCTQIYFNESIRVFIFVINVVMVIYLEGFLFIV